MIETTIKQLDRTNLQDFNRCDGTFSADSLLLPSADQGEILYIYTKIPPFTKRYPLEVINTHDYLDNAGQIIYLAYLDQDVAGQIRLRRNWNNFAYKVQSRSLANW